MTPLEVAEWFVVSINASDVEHMASLMTPEHTLLDADGPSTEGATP
jgi:hypothetical protein